MKTKAVIIIGGGASGLIAAILIAREGGTVTLLEQNSRIGKKILVSGNGKCNIGNRNITPRCFHSQNPPFVESTLKGYGFAKIETFFHSIGLALIEGREGKIFPMSMQASSVTEILEYEAREAGVEIICDAPVETVRVEKGFFTIESAKGRFSAYKLLLASGSPAAPQLGGSLGGLKLAEDLGHTLLPVYPSLVQLCSEEQWVRAASGVKIEGIVKLYANGEYIIEKRGDLLFTNYGISGLAILDISREVSLRLADYAYCELQLDLMPEWTREQLNRLLLSHLHKGARKPLVLWLQGMLNKKLIPIVLEQSGTKAKKEGDLNRKEIGRLVYALKNLKLSISGTRGFKGAEVATGGIDTTEVDAETMVSRKVPGLYFAGEILDVDGDRGGFNFHFAWTSGMRAAEAIVDNGE